MGLTALTLAQVQELFANDRFPAALKCLALIHEKRCETDLSAADIHTIRGIFNATTLDGLDIHQVREITRTLFCVSHGKSMYYRGPFEKSCSRDLSLNPSTPRRTSRSSLSAPATGRASRASPQGMSPSPTSVGINGPTTPSPSAQSDAGEARHEIGSALGSPPTFPIMGQGDTHMASVPDPSQSLSPNRGRLQRSPASAQPAVGRARDLSSIAEDGSPSHIGRASSAPPVRSTPVMSPEPAPASELPTHRFERGEASRCAPWTIRDKVQRIFNEPIPKDTGSIYAIRVKNREPAMVKIGFTTQPRSDTRIKQLVKEQSQDFDFDDPIFWKEIPIPLVHRVEELVHADLAYFQRNWCVQKPGKNPKNHREFFEIELDKAKQTVDTWLDIIEHVGLKPGSIADAGKFKTLNADPDGMLLGESNTREGWRAMNEDHSRWVALWRKHLVREVSYMQRLQRKARSFGRRLTWLVGWAAFIWAGPDFLGLARMQSYGLLAAALFWNWIFDPEWPLQPSGLAVVGQWEADQILKFILQTILQKAGLPHELV